MCGRDNNSKCAYGTAPLYPFREWAEGIGYSNYDFSTFDDDNCSGKRKLDCANRAIAEITSATTARYLLIGHSAGADAAIITASRVNDHNQIAGIVLLDPTLTGTLEDDSTDLQNMTSNLPKPIFLGDDPSDGYTVYINGAERYPYDLGHMALASSYQVVQDMLLAFGWSELK